MPVCSRAPPPHPRVSGLSQKNHATWIKANRHIVAVSSCVPSAERTQLCLYSDGVPLNGLPKKAAVGGRTYARGTTMPQRYLLRTSPPCTLSGTGSPPPCTLSARLFTRQGLFPDDKCTRCPHLSPCALPGTDATPPCTLSKTDNVHGRDGFETKSVHSKIGPSHVHFPERAALRRVHFQPVCVHGGVRFRTKSVHGGAAGQESAHGGSELRRKRTRREYFVALLPFTYMTCRRRVVCCVGIAEMLTFSYPYFQCWLAWNARKGVCNVQKTR